MLAKNLYEVIAAKTESFLRGLSEDILGCWDSWDYQRESRSSIGNTTSAGLGSEAPHDERDIRYGGQYSDNRAIDIELAEEAKGSEVINRKSNLDSEVPRPPAS